MGASNNLYTNLHCNEWWMVRFVGWLTVGPDRLASGKFEYRSRKFRDCGLLKSALVGRNNMEVFLLMIRVTCTSSLEQNGPHSLLSNLYMHCISTMHYVISATV
jgi:hypothetical protein